MAYLGRKGASAALTSSDIPDGSISAVKVAADVATQAEIDLKANLASPTLVTPTIANMANCTFPAGHVLQVVRKPNVTNTITTASPNTTTVWEADADDLHITVTAGNMVCVWISGGMLKAEDSVVQFETWVRFSENSGSANQDFWVTSHLGGNFTPDLYLPAATISASCIAAHTGEMLIKRGVRNSNTGVTMVWSADGSSYAKVNYIGMEIQQ